MTGMTEVTKAMTQTINYAQITAETTFQPPCNTPTTPPQVKVASAHNSKKIIIENLPPIAPTQLDHSALERIINHIKDAYVDGQYDDSELECYCKNRPFCACISYTFAHDGKNLYIDFHISYTNASPCWIVQLNLHEALKNVPKKQRKELMKKLEANDNKKISVLAPMPEQDVDVLWRAFLRQCTKALQGYVNMVHEDAVKHNITPNYYAAPQQASTPTVQKTNTEAEITTIS